MHKSLKILLSSVRFVTVALLAMLIVAAPDQMTLEYQDFTRMFTCFIVQWHSRFQLSSGAVKDQNWGRG